MTKLFIAAALVLAAVTAAASAQDVSLNAAASDCLNHHRRVPQTMPNTEHPGAVMLLGYREDYDPGWEHCAAVERQWQVQESQRKAVAAAASTPRETHDPAEEGRRLGAKRLVKP